MVQRLKMGFVQQNRAIIALLALYLILSLYRLGDIPTPWYDEVVHLNTAWHVSIGGHTWCDFYTDKFQENRMFNSMQFHWLMLGAWIKLFGCGMFAARLFHVILSAMTLFFVYLFGARVACKKVGLYSALFCAFSFMFFHNSRQIMPQVPAALFSVIAFLCFEIAGERKGYAYYIAAAFFAAMSYLSHPIGLGTFFIISALFFLRKIPARFLFAYLAFFAAAMMPYWAYVLFNFREYARQTSIILKEIYQSQPVILNILDEIPVRYFGLPPFRALHQSVGAGNTYMNRLKWIFGYLDLRIMACEIGRSLLLILPLAYLAVKKNKTAGEKTIFSITGLYVLLMSFHPNKFPLYLYILVPYFSICLAVLIRDLFKRGTGTSSAMALKISLAIVLLALFTLTNVVFIGKELFSGKIGRYDDTVARIKEMVPAGSVVAAPVYFWPGMFRDYRFVSVNEIVYAIEKSLNDSGNKSGFTALPESKKDELIKSVLTGKNIEYVFITTHMWDGLTEAPGPAKGLEKDARRYVFNNGQKILDLLKVYYYRGLPEAKNFEDEVYDQPLGRPGFQNVSEEYQKGLKIYKLK